jgi:hypothetical protein
VAVAVAVAARCRWAEAQGWRLRVYAVEEFCQFFANQYLPVKAKGPASLCL